MAYTVYGKIEERRVHITWTDGYLEGDAEALEELIALADVLKNKAVGVEPDGPFTYQHHLANPLSALILIEDIFDEILQVRGKIPAEYPGVNAAA
ncbi:Hypothetical protein PBC10988_15040 [Planctomycetales bacterium 10988]|nr:Hypothetical protein PBC10988_15040 [Planctomycetales bacterium 10988]